MGEADVFEVVPFDGAARVVTIGPDAKGVWTQAKPPKLGDGFEGAFVRLVPPKGTKDSRVQEVEQLARKAGAAAVKVVHPKEDATVVASVVEAQRSTPRETVMRMVEESRSRDHDALRALCDRQLSENGL
jgi:hypothetical protein